MPHHEGGRFSHEEIQRYLQGCTFPCSKRDLVTYCRTKNCPTELVEFMDRMPDRQYFSMSDVMQSVGEVR